MKALLVGSLALLPLLAAGCGGGEELPASRVFGRPVWERGEQLAYTVRDRGEVRGSCLLSVEEGGDPEEVRLITSCGNPDGSRLDERNVLVEESTLRPISSVRTIRNVEKNSRTTFTADYGDKEVVLAADANGDRSEAERELPQPSPEEPDPGFYDDASLFWLIRGVPLEAGFDRAFLDVNPGNARTVRVRIVVTGSETVSVAAGDFDVWRVELRTESITQIMWVEKRSPQRIVLARIEREFHELDAPAAP